MQSREARVAQAIHEGRKSQQEYEERREHQGFSHNAQRTRSFREEQAGCAGGTAPLAILPDNTNSLKAGLLLFLYGFLRLLRVGSVGVRVCRLRLFRGL